MKGIVHKYIKFTNNLLNFMILSTVESGYVIFYITTKNIQSIERAGIVVCDV